MPIGKTGTNEHLLPNEPTKGKENKAPTPQEQSTKKAVKEPLKLIGDQSPSKTHPAQARAQKALESGASFNKNTYLKMAEGPLSEASSQNNPKQVPRSDEDKALVKNEKKEKMKELTKGLLKNEHNPEPKIDIGTKERGEPTKPYEPPKPK